MKPVTETAPAIRLEGLTRDFGDRPALAGVDLQLGAGKTLAVLGPNGSGKTTLLRILAGLLRPTAGEAVVLGAGLPSETWKLRGRIGYLGHEPLLYRDLSPDENLMLAARLHGIGRETASARIAELLETVGLAHRSRDRLAEFSAGMAQRVAACRAVLHEPELLLLDEPDSHLDPVAREVVGELLGPAPGRTRVVVSHQRDEALAGADASLELA